MALDAIMRLPIHDRHAPSDHREAPWDGEEHNARASECADADGELLLRIGTHAREEHDCAVRYCTQDREHDAPHYAGDGGNKQQQL